MMCPQETMVLTHSVIDCGIVLQWMWAAVGPAKSRTHSYENVPRRVGKSLSVNGHATERNCWPQGPVSGRYLPVLLQPSRNTHFSISVGHESHVTSCLAGSDANAFMYCVKPGCNL